MSTAVMAPPFWFHEEAWVNSNLDCDMLQKVHLDNALKPTRAEWKAYFYWLTNVIGYPSADVALIRKQKMRQRRINVRVCMFLHFHRAGIPSDLIISGQFASMAGWRKEKRKAWKKASFIYVPSVDKSVDWWCSSDPEPSLKQRTNLKICHRLQTSEMDGDEEAERKQLMTDFLVIATKVQTIVDKAKSIQKDFNEYKIRYAEAPYADLVDSEKEIEVQDFIAQIDVALKETNDEASAEKLDKLIDSAFSCALQCYQSAHVFYAEETSKREEAERKQKQKEEAERLAKEKEAKEAKEEAERIENERKKEQEQKIEEEKRRKIQEEKEEERKRNEAQAIVFNEEASEIEDKNEPKETQMEHIEEKESKATSSIVPTPNVEKSEEQSKIEAEQEKMQKVEAEAKEKALKESILEPEEVITLKEGYRDTIPWSSQATGTPMWLREDQKENGLEVDIFEKISTHDNLKPSTLEWDAYFEWLEHVAKFSARDVKIIRKQKKWQRNLSARLCLFLHFYRLDIPISQISAGKFGNSATWKDSDRLTWRSASFVSVPLINNSIDWWCSSDGNSFVDQYSKIRICHELQSSRNDVDEIVEKRNLITLYTVLDKNIMDAKEDGEKLLADVEEYKERYSHPPFVKLVNKKKEAELTYLSNVLKTLLSTVCNQDSLDKLRRAHDSLFASTLYCYQAAHVAYAAEKSRIEEEAREVERKEKERLEREETERIEREEREKQAEKEEQEKIKREKEEEEKREKVESLAKLKKEEQKERAKRLFESKDAPEVEEQEMKGEGEAEDAPKEKLTPFEQEREDMRHFLHKDPVSTGVLVFDVYDSIERFTAERIVLIGKQLEMNEEELINLLQVNQKIADLNRRNIKRSQRRKRPLVSESLSQSGLM